MIVMVGERIVYIPNIDICALALSLALSHCGLAHCDVVWPFVEEQRFNTKRRKPVVYLEMRR